MSAARIHLIAFRPGIAGNLGTTARTCVGLGAHLHVIKPTVFPLEKSNATAVKRASVGYFDDGDVHMHLYENMDDFAERFISNSGRKGLAMYIMSKRAKYGSRNMLHDWKVPTSTDAMATMGSSAGTGTGLRTARATAGKTTAAAHTKTTGDMNCNDAQPLGSPTPVVNFAILVGNESYGIDQGFPDHYLDSMLLPQAHACSKSLSPHPVELSSSATSSITVESDGSLGSFSPSPHVLLPSGSRVDLLDASSIFIPMQPRCRAYNVSVAAGMGLIELRRQLECGGWNILPAGETVRE